VNVNLAPVDTKAFKELEAAKIGTYQVFQETYDRDLYAKIHKSGKKADFNWRVTAMHHAMEAGVGDVGVGVLYGLADWRFDSLSLLRSILGSLEKSFGFGCHTISVPRLEPAHGTTFTFDTPHAVNGRRFQEDRCHLAALRFPIRA
jgi:2-iminoacetate synthase